MKIFAADIGGTFVKTCLVDETGYITDFKEYETESQNGGKYIIEMLMQRIALYEDIDAIAISTAGQVDSINGEIIFANKNIPNYTGLKVKAIIQKKFPVPVVIENDVNSAALGELRYGAGQNVTDCLCLTYGTGIGGAIIIDSSLFKGTDGVAGEFGHMITKPIDSDMQTTPGFYEHYASTKALVRMAKEVEPECVNGRVIFEKYTQGNESIVEVFNIWVNEVATGLVSLIHIFNPSMIIIGGGIMEQEKVVEMVNIKVKELLLDSFMKVKILKADLGNKAGLLGVASLLM